MAPVATRQRPSLQEFLSAPPEVVAAVAPQTMIYAVGGTRRSAALSGIALGDEYARWSEPRFRATTALCFHLGVRHLIAPVGRPQIFAETGIYRREFCRWITLALTNDAALTFYRRANWRVRLIVAGAALPELADTASRLEEVTREATGPRLWVLTTPDYDALWRWILASGAVTREAAVARLFGEAIPPATLLLSFGKPLVALDHLPPMLFEEIQCYWTQRPGYSLTERELRTILYDRAYLRSTWRHDKTGRERDALRHRHAWGEHAPLIGLGRRLGPYWYPVTHTPASSLPVSDPRALVRLTKLARPVTSAKLAALPGRVNGRAAAQKR
jgi:hypothetical protein